MNIKFREASLADSDQIVRLSNRCFKTPLKQDDWEWFTLSNPRGEDRQYIVEESGGDIVACFSFFPTILQLHGSYLRASFAHHFMIDKSYRNTITFIQLSKYAFEKESSLDVELLITAPNKASYLPHRMLMGWSDLFELKVLTKSSSGSGLMIGDVDNDVIPSDAEIKQFLEKANKNMNFVVYKDFSWFEWRYRRRPENPYRILYQCVGERLLGICILKSWIEPDGYSKLHIIDLIVEDKGALSALLQRVDVLGSKFHEINLWSSDLNPSKAVLDDFGFFPSEGRTQPVIVRGLKDKDIPAVTGTALFCYGDGDLQF